MKRLFATVAIAVCLSIAGCDNTPSSHLAVTDDNFREVVLQSDKPVLLDCWAPWCGPCRQLSPTIDELAEDYKGRVLVAKLNVDEATQTARQLRVVNIPMVVIFQDGEIVNQRIGLQPKGNYAGDLDRLLSGE